MESYRNRPAPVHAALALLLATSAMAQNFPVRPVRMVLGYPPGGGIDVMATIMAKLSECWVLLEIERFSGREIACALAPEAHP